MSKVNSNNQRYLLIISILFVLLLLATNFVLKLKFNNETLQVVINGILAMFYVSTVLSGIVVIRSAKKRSQDIVQASMLSITLKFLGYLVVLGIVLYLNKSISKEIVGFFFCFYFLFTITEKTFILKFLKKE